MRAFGRRVDLTTVTVNQAQSINLAFFGCLEERPSGQVARVSLTLDLGDVMV
jgi:hypothetical protein